MAAQGGTLRATGRVARRQMVSRAARWILLAASLIGVGILLFLGYETVREGAGRLSLDFLTSYPSRKAEQAGLRSSALGSAWVLGTTVVVALPVAVGTAI
ncbi:MAG TPA: phosphate ABC transporter, permease protein PstA, partial [Dehalococcoidia bacterium]|nr:phosphate ABC transporter, permease protein PstA [Dehalococcoidia bacterium]